MRGLLVLSGLLFTSALCAAPAPPLPPSPARPVPTVHAQVYAQQLVAVLEQIERLYVRPVSRADLVYAGLAGLYDGARRPVPRNLKARVTAAWPDAVVEQEPVAIAGYVPPPSRALLDLMQQAYRDVLGAEALAGQEPLLVSCRAVGRVLDPYSGVVTAEEQRRNIGLDDECDGVGLELQENVGAGPLLVRRVLPGSPAQRAGIRPGDQITHLDGKPVRGRPSAARLLSNHRPPSPGPPGSDMPMAGPPGLPAPLEVTLSRGGKAAGRVVLERTRFRPETVLGVAREDDNGWNYFVDRKRRIAHVRLASLSRGTAEELRGVLTTLRDEGLRGLVLDLRWCPGGFLNEAVEAAGLFLDAGTVATVKMRREESVYRSAGEGKFQSLPLVVLVNGETSGGAELIAASLQDRRRAVIAGQRTRGKASVQTPLSLPVAGVGFKVTSGTFVRPSGKNLHRFPESKASDDWGICPSPGAEFRISADLSRALAGWWQRQTLRPGSSRTRLPLDDPLADPQRQAALRVLQRRLDTRVRAKGE